ncbi:MAG: T9SS type A sorting domain-containing protein [Bacteroidetes bacterium]|nr:T9SS type A sorting domain-containing protein [Bacteroidota bacterium]
MVKNLFFILLFPLTSIAQSVSVNDTIRFLALGDSYTIGQSVAINQKWPVQLSDSLLARGVVTDTMRIIATTGWCTDNLLNAISGQNLENQHYNLVSLLIGVNNQYQGSPFSQYTTEFPALLDSAILYAGGNKNHVFIVSIPDYAYTPYGQQTSNPAQITAELQQYNQYAKHIADSLQIKFFDITPISQQGLQNPNYVANDGLHPSGLQYSKWVKLMLDSLNYNLTTSVKSQNKKENAVVISPNPVTDIIKIDVFGEELFYWLEIYNSTGQLLQKTKLAGSVTYISTNELATGLYSIKLSNGKSHIVKKIIKI